MELSIVLSTNILRLFLLMFLASSILRIGKLLSTSKYSRKIRGLGGKKYVLTEVTIKGIPFIFSRAFKIDPIGYTVLTTYHITFMLIFLLYPPHIILISRLLGIPLTPPINMNLVFWDTLTFINMGCILIIMFRRILDKIRGTVRGRFIRVTGFINYIILFLLPLTGYFATHGILTKDFIYYHTLLSGIYFTIFPFTPTFHAILVFISRAIKGWRTGW